jgi:hypothetical protein
VRRGRTRWWTSSRAGSARGRSRWSCGGSSRAGAALPDRGRARREAPVLPDPVPARSGPTRQRRAEHHREAMSDATRPAARRPPPPRRAGG